MEIGKRYRDTKLRQLLEDNIYHGNREEIQRYKIKAVVRKHLPWK